VSFFFFEWFFCLYLVQLVATAMCSHTFFLCNLMEVKSLWFGQSSSRMDAYAVLSFLTESYFQVAWCYW
jgi:hypothetical protein